MGFRLEIYNENYAGLVVDPEEYENNKYYCNTDSIKEAMKYFDLYYDESTHRIKKYDPNQKVVDELSIDAENVEKYQSMVHSLIINMSDEEILNYILLMPEWNNKTEYKVNDRVRYESIPFRCLQDCKDINPIDYEDYWMALIPIERPEKPKLESEIDDLMPELEVEVNIEDGLASDI